MIYVTDISSPGTQHEQFNISFIKLLKLRYADTQIIFIGDESHIDVLRTSVPNIKYQSIQLYHNRGGLKEFIRAYKQFISLKRITKSAEANRVDHIYILLVHPLAHYLFKRFTKTDINIAIVIHGELESIKFNKHFLNKIWGFFLKKALEIKSPSTKYIILGDSIYKNLSKLLPSFTQHDSIILDHPYPFTLVHKKLPDNKQIVFSSLGVATLPKNSQYLFEVAQAASRLNLHDRGKFNICGRVYKNMEPYLNEYVNYKQRFESLTRGEVNSLVSESDFAVFYYDNSHYSLCASGAFWDAVNAEIPILYVHNDYFDYYANIVGGIGLAFETPHKLNDYILKLLKAGDLGPQYALYVENMRALKFGYMSTNHLLEQLNQ
jgi:hypothetical protein